MRCHPYFIENDDSGQLGGVLRVNGLRENNKINESLEETNNRNDLNWAKNCDVPWGISKPNSKLVLIRRGLLLASFIAVAGKTSLVDACS